MESIHSSLRSVFKIELINRERVTNYKVLCLKNVSKKPIMVASKNRTLFILTLKRPMNKNRTPYRSLYNKLPYVYSGLKPHTIFSEGSEKIRSYKTGTIH